MIGWTERPVRLRFHLRDGAVCMDFGLVRGSRAGPHPPGPLPRNIPRPDGGVESNTLPLPCREGEPGFPLAEGGLRNPSLPAIKLATLINRASQVSEEWRIVPLGGETVS